MTDQSEASDLPEAAVLEPRRWRRGRLAQRTLAPIGAGLIALGLWYLVRDVFLIPDLRYMLPSPWQIVTQGFGDPDLLAEIFQALWVTSQITLLGLVIAVLVGTAWGALMSQAKWLEDALYPYAVILQSIPIVSIVPLIGFWFDAALRAKVIVVVLCAVFPMVSYAFFGFTSVDAAHRDLFRLGGASRWQVFTKLQFPAALPALATGVQVAGSLSVVGAIIADYFFSRGDYGIGNVLEEYQRAYEAIPLFTVIIVACLLGVVVFLVLGALGRLLVGRWNTQRQP